MGSKTFKATVLAAIASTFSLSAAAVEFTPWQTLSTGLQGTGGATTTLNFDQYNPADWGGAALHNVEMMLNGTTYLTYQVQNYSGSLNDFDLDVDITMVVDDPTSAGNFLLAVANTTDVTRSLAPFGDAGDTYTSPGYPSTFTSGLTSGGTDSDTFQGATLTPALISLFTGTGTVGIDTFANQNNNSSSTGDVGLNIFTRYDAELQIRYSYEPAGPTPTPEPATLLLFGAGIAGIGFSLNRRKARA